MDKRRVAHLLTGGAVALVAVFAVPAPASAVASVIHVATSGSDTSGCGSTASPCASVAFAYAEAAPGDTIKVAAGTYTMTAPLLITKAGLQFEGAEAGVDARTRTPGAPGETVITATLDTPIQEDMWVAQADGVSVDGFTFAGNADGAGLSTSENFSGYLVENDIFSNNLKGLAPSSDGAQPSLFARNLYENNNNTALHPGSQGNGVFTYRPLANAVFRDSRFLENHNAPINISGGEVIGGSSNITITDNDMDGEFPVVLVAVTDAAITHNSMVGGWSGAQVSGACHDILIADNTITDKTRGAILVFTGFAQVTNTGVTVEGNTIERTATVPGRYGVEISRTSGVTVRDNLILDSGYDAIGFTPRDQTEPSSNATIMQNTIGRSHGADSGIHVSAGSYTGAMTVHYNRIVDSTSGHGLVNNDPAAHIDARWNWWGCNTMPHGHGCDQPAGTSADTVTFSPWLVLHISSNPADIHAGHHATILATLNKDSNGAVTAGPFFQPVTAEFTTTVGHVTPTSVLTDALLHAPTVWPAGQQRPQYICVTIDNQTECLYFPPNGGAGIEVPSPPATTETHARIEAGIPAPGSGPDLTLIAAGTGLLAVAAALALTRRRRTRTTS